MNFFSKKRDFNSKEYLTQFTKHINISNELRGIKFDFPVPLDSKLIRLYDWENGDLPAQDDLVQWLLLAIAIVYNPFIYGQEEFMRLWKVISNYHKKKLLPFVLNKLHPHTNYKWQTDIPIDDPEIFLPIPDHLVELYPYIFNKSDVPFLFDKRTPPPGSGHPRAWNLDISRAYAVTNNIDETTLNEFKIAISNEHPLRPSFIKYNDGSFRIKLSKADSKHDENNKFSNTINNIDSNIPVSDETMIVPTSTVRMMVESAKLFVPESTKLTKKSLFIDNEANESLLLSNQTNIPDESLKVTTDNKIESTSKGNEKFSDAKSKPRNQNRIASEFEDNQDTYVPNIIKPDVKEKTFIPSIIKNETVTSPVAMPFPEQAPKIKINSEPLIVNQSEDPHTNENGKNNYATIPSMDPTYIESKQTSLPSENQQHKKTVNYSTPTLKEILPNIPPPYEGEEVVIGSGITKKILGRGGQALVLQIWCKLLECFRATKLFLPPNLNAIDVQEYMRGLARFEREVKIGATLNHTNIVSLHMVGEWNKYRYIEMEYVDGIDIRLLLSNYGRVPPDVALAMIAIICDALHFAHEKVYTVEGKRYYGLVHKDLKPANIMLDRQGIIKVLDFGIAQPMGFTSLTMQHGMVGTLLYSSPEQVNGYELDHRSDIYSLGAVLYELVTGVTAIGGPNVQAILNNILNGTYRKLDNFNFNTPKSVKYILDKAMKGSPDRRFQTAEEMSAMCLDALSKFSPDTPNNIVKKYIRQKGIMDSTGLSNYSTHIAELLRKKKKRFFFF
jgi:tRNA A-37 threonylcarbamoyl transferase component Bud32